MGKKSLLPTLLITLMLMVALLGTCALMMAQLLWPYNIDQGMFAFVGSAIARGDAPYLDAWELKGVVVHLVYGWLEMLWGKAFWTIRLFDLLMVASGMAAVMVVGKRQSNLPIALFGACLLGVAMLPDNWAAAQPDGWAALFMLMVMAAVVMDDGRFKLRYAIMAGGLMTLMSCIKPFYALFYLLPILYTYSHQVKAKLRSAWLKKMLLSSIIVGGVIAAWLWQMDALGAMWEMWVSFNLNAHQNDGENAGFLTSQEKRNALGYFFLDSGRWVISLSALLGLGFIFATRHLWGIFCLIWLVLGVMWVVIQGKYIAYHCLVMLPPMVILSLHFFHAVYHYGRKSNGKLAFTLLMGGMIYALHSVPLFYVQSAWDYRQGTLSQKDYYRLFPVVGKDIRHERIGQGTLNDMQEIADFLAVDSVQQGGTQPPTLQLWSMESILYFVADVTPATRFGHLYPMIAGEPKDYAPYRKELLDALEQNPPDYIIVGDNDANALLKGLSSAAHKKAFLGFDHFVKTRYDLHHSVNDYAIYRHKDESKDE